MEDNAFDPLGGRAFSPLAGLGRIASGSHIRLGKNAVRVTVPDHKTIAPGTLKSILKQAGLDLQILIGER